MDVLLILLGLVGLAVALWLLVVGAYFAWLLLPALLSLGLAAAFFAHGHDNLGVLAIIAGIILNIAWLNGSWREKIGDAFKRK